MYDDVLGIAASGTAGTGAVLAQTGGDVGPLLIVAWGLALAGTSVLAVSAKLRARKQQQQ
jgi:hypothetical protein